jgi:hypothetical protein
MGAGSLGLSGDFAIDRGRRDCSQVQSASDNLVNVIFNENDLQ